ncbi:hypothetical protein [Inquilinus limosus]|uniref:hypothetical protein n=1 Tax=Inquilinus limosus TaxID=171674 RepID=UPI0012DD9249|nr:hypothetical protein [Inquilinus limosus]
MAERTDAGPQRPGSSGTAAFLLVIRRITDSPGIPQYSRNLEQRPAFRHTSDFFVKPPRFCEETGQSWNTATTLL